MNRVGPITKNWLLVLLLLLWTSERRPTQISLPFFFLPIFHLGWRIARWGSRGGPWKVLDFRSFLWGPWGPIGILFGSPLASFWHHFFDHFFIVFLLIFRSILGPFGLHFRTQNPLKMRSVFCLFLWSVFEATWTPQNLDFEALAYTRCYFPLFRITHLLYHFGIMLDAFFD